MRKHLSELFGNKSKMSISIHILDFVKRTPLLDPSNKYYIEPPIEKVWVLHQKDDVIYLASATIELSEKTSDKEVGRKLRRIFRRSELPNRELKLDFVKTNNGIVLVL